MPASFDRRLGRVALSGALAASLLLAPSVGSGAAIDEAPPVLSTLAEARLGHSSPVRDVRWIADGKRIVSTAGGRTVCWDASDGHVVWNLGDDAEISFGVAAGARGTAVVRARGHRIESIGTAGSITARADDPDAEFSDELSLDAAAAFVALASVRPRRESKDPGEPVSLIVRRVSDLAVQWTAPLDRDARICSLLPTPDGRGICWATVDGCLGYSTADSSAESSRLASTGHEHRIIAQTSPRRWLLLNVDTHRLSSVEIGIRPAGGAAASVARITDVRPELSDISQVAAIDAEHVVLSRATGAIMVAALGDPREDREIGSFSDQVTCLDVMPGRPTLLAAGFRSGVVRVFDLQGQERQFPRAHFGAVTAAEASRDGRVFATVDRSGQVVVWPHDGRRPMRTIDKLGAPLALSDDGTVLAGCTARGEVQGVFLTDPVRRTKPLPAYGRPVNTVCFVPGSLNLLVGSGKPPGADGRVVLGNTPTLQLLDLESGRELYAVDTGGHVRHMSVSPDASRVVVGNYDFIDVRGIKDGQLMDRQRINRPDRTITQWVESLDIDYVTGSVVFIPDAFQDAPDWRKYVWAKLLWRDHVGPPHSSQDGRQEFLPLGTTQDDLRIVRWIPGGRWCVAGGAGGLELFDVLHPDVCQRRWQDERRTVVALCVVDGGRALVTADDQGTVKLWDLSWVRTSASTPKDGK
jgi:WD40 repeat protein